MVAAAVKTFGGLNFAFNNAGIEGNIMVPLAKYSEATWDDVIDINLKGMFLSMKYEIPHIKTKFEDLGVEELLRKIDNKEISEQDYQQVLGRFGHSQYPHVVKKLARALKIGSGDFKPNGVTDHDVFLR